MCLQGLPWGGGSHREEQERQIEPHKTSVIAQPGNPDWNGYDHHEGLYT